jgi:hypothetical protein
MAEPDYSTASWVDFTSGQGSQGEVLTAPPLSTNPQLQYRYMYGQPPFVPISHTTMPPMQEISDAHIGSQSQGRSPYPPIGSPHQYYPHIQPSHHFPGSPRPPPAFWSGSDQPHVDLGGFYNARNTVRGPQPYNPFSTSGHDHQVLESSSAGQPPLAQRRYDPRATMSSVARESLADGVRVPREELPSSSRVRSREVRPAHQEQRQPSDQTYRSIQQRPWMFSEFQGHGFDGSISPRTSNRRNFERYSIDLSHSSTSSDAEEAAARAPPSNRVRHRPGPGEMRQRFLSQRPHFDPNIATPQQIQELKDKLPRRLPSELSDETSRACDICQKDYSSTQVQPAEEEEIAIELSCGHVFGEFCIFQWVRCNQLNNCDLY